MNAWILYDCQAEYSSASPAELLQRRSEFVNEGSTVMTTKHSAVTQALTGGKMA